MSLSPEGRDDLDEAFSRLYDRVRELAGKLVRRERAGDRFDATELVHECFIRLAQMSEFRSLGKSRFLSLASQVIRRALVDEAKRRRAVKRGGAWGRVTMSSINELTEDQDLDIVGLDEAMQRLERFDDNQAKIVEMRFFGGMSMVEIGTLLGVTTRMVERDWVMARAWLRRELA